MKQNGWAPRVSQFIAILAAVGVLVYWGLRFWPQAPGRAAPPEGIEINPSGTYRAHILEITESGEVDLGGFRQAYQIVRVQVLEGPWEESTFAIDYGKRQFRPDARPLEVGDRILVSVSRVPGQLPQAYFVDFVRTSPLLWLLGAFVVVSLLISGWKGVRSLLAMLLSLTIITAYILPRILAGDDPVWVSITGAFFILASTLYLVYGWTLKTQAAVLGTLTALILTGVLAGVFVDLTHLSGFGSEEALFLGQQQAGLSLRGLVLGGILIGALGVLDDLVITQASVIFELHAANPAAAFPDLFRRGMRVGQDHVAATVNTLVLAYVGAALPLLLLVSLAGENWFNFANRELIAEEIVRTLVGSLGLMAAVPLTTGLASLVAINQARLGWLGEFLGSARHGAAPGHHHTH